MKSEIRLQLLVSSLALKRHFKTDKVVLITEPIPNMQVKFSNGILWRCILNGIGAKEDSYKNEEIVLIKCDLIDADISKSTYEIIFTRPDGDVILKSREIVKPLELLG